MTDDEITKRYRRNVYFAMVMVVIGAFGALATEGWGALLSAFSAGFFLAAPFVEAYRALAERCLARAAQEGGR
jgi:uncharacterized membrane protein YjjP (DUF1212 family)